MIPRSCTRLRGTFPFSRRPMQLCGSFGPTLYVDAHVVPGGTLELQPAEIERAVYSVNERLIVDGTIVEPLTLAVLDPSSSATITAPDGARYVVIGGAPLDGHRYMWWNFVSSSKERIEQAKRAWATQRMGSIPGETEWISLPV